MTARLLILAATLLLGVFAGACGTPTEIDPCLADRTLCDSGTQESGRVDQIPDRP